MGPRAGYKTLHAIGGSCSALGLALVSSIKEQPSVRKAKRTGSQDTCMTLVGILRLCSCQNVVTWTVDYGRTAWEGNVSVEPRHVEG
jgi:hypothetical protein